MKTVIVTPQLPIARSGGIGTFVWHFTQLLRNNGEDVGIILAFRPEAPRKQWIRPYEQLGVEVICVDEPNNPLHVPFGYDWHQAVSERVAEIIPEDTDIVYVADWEANGFHLVQSRRFRPRRLPAIVAVLHGSSAWDRQGRRQWPQSYEDLALDLRERYVAMRSDFVAAPSHYVVEWSKMNGWSLPSDPCVSVLKYPYFPPTEIAEPASQPGGYFKRIIFFGGHIDARKGVDLFVGALEELSGRPCMASVQEIVLLGPGGPNEPKTPSQIANDLSDELPGVKVEALTDLNTFEAQSYLRQHAHNSLVVMPSRSETMGYTVIEASLIPHIRLLCSSAGGIPEVFGPDGKYQMFEPFLKPLARKLEQWLEAGPAALQPSAQYDWESANRNWLSFHEDIRNYANAIRPHRDKLDVSGPLATTGQPSVDICVPYYNLGAYLPYLLTALADQTTQDFNLFIVNDGSTDPKSIAVFEEMKREYQARQNWTFVSTENQGVCVTRNFAASLGKAEYICFADPDNIPTPHMVERFLEAIRLSGDDCLTCYMYIFRGEKLAFKPSGLLHPPTYHYVPIGNFPPLGMMENPFGDGNCIMRRSVFEAVGGFTTDFPHEINHEDRELLTRVALAGYKLDVIPEFLLYYREREDSRLRSTDLYLNESRVLRHYQKRLREVGLDDLAPLLLGFHDRARTGGFSRQDTPDVAGSDASSSGDSALLDTGVSLDTPPIVEEAIASDSTTQWNDQWALVYYVKGSSLLRALRTKARNKIVKRFGLRPKP